MTELGAVHALTVGVEVGGAAPLAVGDDGSVWPACLGNGIVLSKLLGDFVRVVFVYACGDEKVAASFDVGGVVVVLAGVGGFVFEDLDEFVEARGYDGA